MMNEAAQYRKSVKAHLQCDKNTKERLLSDFDRILSSYLEEYPNPSMDDLVSAFGPVEEMANSLVKEITPQEKAQYQKSKFFSRIVAIILTSVLVLFTAYVLFIKEFRITATHEIHETTNDWDKEYIPIEEMPTP